MTSYPPPTTPESDLTPWDVLKVLSKSRVPIVAVTVVTTLVVAAAAAAYLLWLQPVRRSSVLEFRPMFTGAADGKYPNDLPFATTDITDATNLDLVYDRNAIQQFCARDLFRGAFFVDERSDEASFLQLEYQTRLADPRLTTVDRQAIVAEYEAKRDGLPVQYRLTFVKPPQCSGLPDVVVAKAMTDLLATWATESEQKRGVLNLRIDVPTPAMLDVDGELDTAPVVRADLVRSAILRIVANVEKLEQTPGAHLIRVGPDGLGLTEVRNKLTDLVHSRLEPLAIAARTSASAEWAKNMVAAAERDQHAGTARAASYQSALRDYSTTVTGQPTGSAPPPRTPAKTSEEAGLSPQVFAFMQRMTDLSAPNQKFRQELTRSMLDATADAIAAEQRASYYRGLLTPGGATVSEAEFNRQLNAIVKEGKALTQRVDDLYAEFSRVALRPEAGMYRTVTPVTNEVSRPFSTRQALFIVLAAFFASLIAVVAYVLVRDRLRAGAPEQPPVVHA